MGRIAGALLALMTTVPLLGGCFTHTYVVSGTTPEERPSHVEWRHHLFTGLISLDGDIDLRDRCPQGVALVEDEMELINGIVWLLTATIYSPTTVDIYCQEPQGAPQAPTPGEGAPRTTAPGEVPVVELPPPSEAPPAEAPTDADVPGASP